MFEIGHFQVVANLIGSAGPFRSCRHAMYYNINLIEDKDTELESWMKLGMMASNHTFKGAAH